MKKHKTKQLVFIAFGFLWFFTGFAQVSVNASGSDATGLGGSVAYSVGQVEYISISSPDGSVDQGVQHAYEIYSLDVNETPMNLSASVFPNPTDAKLTLTIEQLPQETLVLIVYDLLGRELYQQKIVEVQTPFSLDELPSATYFVDVQTSDGKKIRTFKIIKK